jgi:hypothetical protein
LNIWFVVWIFISTFIIGTSLWSYVILARQKKAWQTVSQKSNLAYSSEAILKSPYLTGIFKGIKVDIFSARPITGRVRETSSRTILQFTLKAPMPCEGAIGSLAFKNFIDGLSLPDGFTGEGQDILSKDIYNRVKNAETIKPYFTPARISALNAILNIKGMPALLLFSATETVLRIESADPFDDPARLEKFLNKATEAAKIISV